jgi:hypothetical protein
MFRAQQPISGRADKLEVADVVAEAPAAMMVLAVDVVGDRSTHGHEPRPGRDRQAPSPLQHSMLDIPEQHTGFAAQNPGIGIELEQSVELAKID